MDRSNLFSYMEEINPKSVKFIAWVEEYLANQANYISLLDEALGDLEDFLSQDKTEILFLLKGKLILGAKEHGEPFYTQEEVRLELLNECLDLVGWSLIGKYNLQLKEKKR